MWHGRCLRGADDLRPADVEVVDRGLISSWAVDEELAGFVGRLAKRPVPRCEQDVVGINGKRAREMDRVVSAERVSLCQLAGVTSKRFVDADDP